MDLIPHAVGVLPGSLASKKRLGVEGTSLILTLASCLPTRGPSAQRKCSRMSIAVGSFEPDQHRQRDLANPEAELAALDAGSVIFDAREN